MVDAVTLSVDGVEVARYVDGSEVADPQLSPRPFLHPIRTLGGTVVTDCMPEDHRWHLGLSVAVQDVGGFNFWGGRTYLRDHGYTWRDDHGAQRHHAWLELAPDRCVQQLGWYAPDGRCLLDETRSLQAAGCEVAGRRAWTLTVGIELRNVTGEPLAVGSPATNGRVGAGYGGLFWRLPRSASEPQVFTATASGEAAVHGSRDPWLAWVATAPAYTVVLVQGPGVSLASTGQPSPSEPWFVRAESYPGLCSALAFEKPALVAVGGVLQRTYRAFVVDGALDRAAVTTALEDLARDDR